MWILPLMELGSKGLSEVNFLTGGFSLSVVLYSIDVHVNKAGFLIDAGFF